MKGLQMIKRMRQMASGQGMLEQMAEQLLPMAEPVLQQMFEKFNKPVEEGGLLEENDYGVGFSIMPIKKEEGWTFIYLIVVYAYDPPSGRMYISKKKPVSELVNTQSNDNGK